MSTTVIDRKLSDLVTKAKAADRILPEQTETFESLDQALKNLELPFELHNNSPLGYLIPREKICQIENLETISTVLNIQALKLLRFIQFMVSQADQYGLNNLEHLYPPDEDRDNVPAELREEQVFKAQDDDLEFSYRAGTETFTIPGHAKITMKSKSRDFALELQVDRCSEELPDDACIKILSCSYTDADNAFVKGIFADRPNFDIEQVYSGFRLSSDDMAIHRGQVNIEEHLPQNSYCKSSAYKSLLDSLANPESEWLPKFEAK